MLVIILNPRVFEFLNGEMILNYDGKLILNFELEELNVNFFI
jgi:hypothetical protein